jgi:hypothetical protein
LLIALNTPLSLATLTKQVPHRFCRRRLPKPGEVKPVLDGRKQRIMIGRRPRRNWAATFGDDDRALSSTLAKKFSGLAMVRGGARQFLSWHGQGGFCHCLGLPYLFTLQNTLSRALRKLAKVKLRLLMVIDTARNPG